MKVLVTGGASGLGKYITKKFAEEKIDVIINYNHSEKEANILKESLQKTGVNVMTIKCDISSEEEVKNMFNQIDSLDYLINNAAIAMDNEIWDKTADEFNKVLSVNLTGTFLVTKYALTKMKKGSIVNISSTNGIDTYYMQSVDYDASKAGVISLTHNFSKYLYDVRVNCICPDWIDTPMNKDMDDDYKSKINFINPKKLAEVIYKVATNEALDNKIVRISGDQNE